MAFAALSLPAAAQNATWLANPGSGDFNDGANWTPATVPTGTAFFGASNITTLTLTTGATVGGFTFAAGAPAYTFNGNVFFDALFVEGAGIVDNGASVTFNIGNFFAVNFLGSSTAGNATIVNDSALAFGDTSTAGSATIVNNQILDFANFSTAGSARITTRNGAITSFVGRADGGNAEFITELGGIVDFRPGTGPNNDRRITVGSIAGAGAYMLDDRTLIVGGNNLSTQMSGFIDGVGGSLIKVGTGTLTLAGVNTYTGGTTVTEGVLAVTGVGALGAPVALLNVDGGVLDLGGTTQTTGALTQAGGVIRNGILNSVSYEMQAGAVSASLTGAGVLNKTGPGTLILSGANTYTGTTTANAGSLIVDGSIAASSGLFINPGALVGGTGVLPATAVQGGVLAPGNSIGTITVNGNLTFGAGGVYRVEISRSDADKTNVTGAATLTGGAVEVVPQALVTRRTRYSILSAAVVSGAFSSVSIANVLASNPSLAVVGGDVFLTVDPPRFSDWLPFAAGANASSVAAGIDRAVAGGTALPDGFVTLLELVMAGRTGLVDQLAGEAATGAPAAGIQMMNQFLSLMLNPFAGAASGNAGAVGYARALGAADAYAAAVPAKSQPADFNRWTVWGGGYGGANRTDGDAAIGAHDTSARTWGFAAGADHRLSGQTTFGFALAGGGTNWSLSQGFGTGRGDAFQAGVYASHRFDAAYVAAALAYTRHWMKTERTVTVADTDALRASFDPYDIGGRIEAGYRWTTRHVGVTPYGAVQVQRFHTPAYAEATATGSAFALAYDSRGITATRFELGSWFDRLVAVGDRAFVLRGRLAWAHDDGSDRSFNAAFRILPGSSFTVNGAAAPSDFALVSAAGEFRLAGGLSLGARFDGEFSGRSQTYAGMGAARYAW